MPDYRDASAGVGLQQILQGLQPLNEYGNELQKNKLQQLLQKQKADVESATQAKAIEQVQELSKQHPGMGVEVSKEGAALKPNPALLTVDLKKQQFDQTQANKYSKGLEKYADLGGAAQDLEKITNRDGKGGVFTNPNASLISSGKVISAIPDSVLGIAEMTGAIPKGAAEERKAIARYSQGLGVALGGARGMAPQTQNQIRQSLGALSSGDPQLMAKGLRGSGRILGQSVKTVQGGFTPEVRGQVHDQMGGDPMDFLGSIAPEPGPASNLNSPPAGNAKQVQQGLPKPQQPQQTQPAQPQMLRVKHKASGQTGTIPANEFDPNTYEQVK